MVKIFKIAVESSEDVRQKVESAAAVLPPWTPERWVAPCLGSPPKASRRVAT